MKPEVTYRHNWKIRKKQLNKKALQIEESTDKKIC